MIGDDGIDLGHGVRYVFVSWRRYERAGILEEHTAPDGKRCGGSVLFDLPGIAEAFPDHELWMVTSYDPLSLTPSLQCSCGHHGWITDGQWVPAS